VTNAEAAALILRLVVGAIFVAQGYRKTFAPADVPHGRAGLVRLISGAGLPSAPLLAGAVGAVELACGLCLLVGLFTAIASLVLSGVLLVAIVVFKWRSGFVGGWDWPLVCLAAVIALLLLGPGPLSLDTALFR
jgi:putative oxidoreductase